MNVSHNDRQVVLAQCATERLSETLMGFSPLANWQLMLAYIYKTSPRAHCWSSSLPHHLWHSHPPHCWLAEREARHFCIKSFKFSFIFWKFVNSCRQSSEPRVNDVTLCYKKQGTKGLRWRKIIYKSSAAPAILVCIMRGSYEVRVDDYSGGKIV